MVLRSRSSAAAGIARSRVSSDAQVPATSAVRAATAAALAFAASVRLLVRRRRAPPDRRVAARRVGPARSLLSAIPDGLLARPTTGGSDPSIARSAASSASSAEDLLGARAPLPVLAARARPRDRAMARASSTSAASIGGADVSGTRRPAAPRARRRARRARGAAPPPPRHGARRLRRATARASARRARDAGRPRPVCSIGASSSAARRRGPPRDRRKGTNVAVVLAELDGARPDGDAGLRQPGGAASRSNACARSLRAGDELARTGTRELGMILPETDAHGGRRRRRSSPRGARRRSAMSH